MTNSWTVSGETLAGVRIFAGLTAESRTEVAAQCHGRRVIESQAIVHRGDSSREVYFVVSGRVRATIFSRAGKEVSFRDMGPGEAFGDLSAIDDQPRSATVVALEDSLLLTMSAAVFRRTLTTYPSVAELVMRELTRLARMLSERVVEFSTLGVSNRIHAELLRLAKACSEDGRSATISPAPTHADIANRISTHREAVTRELNVMARTGLIAKRGGKLQVNDIPRLEQMVRDVKGAQPH